MSGLSRTPGKRVWVNSPPRVRIPPSPPGFKSPLADASGLFALCAPQRRALAGVNRAVS